MEQPTEINLKTTFARLLAYTTLTVICALVIQQDAKMLDGGQKFTENSITEWMQLIFILATLVIFYLTGKFNEPLRPVAHLVSGGFVVILIRELDGYLDVIYNGSWLPPALVVFAVTLWIVLRQRQHLSGSIRYFVATPAFGLFVGGGLGIFVFSRLFGYKGIWKAIFQVEHLDPFGPQKWVKNAAEEGSELFGYCLVFCAAVELFAYVRRVNKSAIES